MNAESLIERAEDGESLNKEDRQQALKQILEEDGEQSNRELANLFGVSERTIYKDRRGIRKELSDKLLNDYGLAGALWLEYRQARHEIGKVKRRAESSDDLKTVRLAVKDRWKLAVEFYDRITEMQVLRRIERLEDQLDLN